MSWYIAILGVFTCTLYLYMLFYSVNEGLIIYYYTKYYKACLQSCHDTFVTEGNLTCQNIGKLFTIWQFYTIFMESYKERIVSAWQDINIGAEFNLSASMTKNGDKLKQLDVDLASRAIKPRIALSRYFT